MYNTQMQDNHQALHNKLDECLTALHNTHDIRAKSTMFKFYKNCRITWIFLDQEMVNCRRLKKVTLKYKELEAEFLEHVHNFEQWHLMASLMY
jgi:hypothetical protein